MRRATLGILYAVIERGGGFTLPRLGVFRVSLFVSFCLFCLLLVVIGCC